VWWAQSRNPPPVQSMSPSGPTLIAQNSIGTRSKPSAATGPAAHRLLEAWAASSKNGRPYIVGPYARITVRDRT
jgi:hypothetical protein